jgi:HAE1 family hydrophobic/amphiphilic exporter-1
VLLVYAVMASQYESLRDPFIIMFSVPVAAIGVVLSLLLTGTSFSMQAYIGIIMLAGIVVSNAILLVDYINTLRRRDGMPLREAVELGGRTRLRPILMTSIATMLGLGADGDRHRRGRRVAGAAGACRHRRLAHLNDGDAGARTAVYTVFEEGLSGLFKRGAKGALVRVGRRMRRHYYHVSRRNNSLPFAL